MRTNWDVDWIVIRPISASGNLKVCLLKKYNDLFARSLITATFDCPSSIVFML